MRRIALLLLCGFLAAETGQQIIKKVEDTLRGKSSTGEMEMTVIKKEWTRTLRFRFWEKGKDKTLIVILSPAKERGMATLKLGKNVWNYLPSIERTIKLPPSMMGQSWMGSHFTNDDLVKEYSLERDYNAKLVREDAEKYYLILYPKETAAVVWGKIEVEVKKRIYVPLRAVYYDERGEKIRELVYSDIRKVGRRYFPFHWVLHPLKKPGEKTELKIIKIKFDVPIPDKIFTLRYLKRQKL